MPKKTLALLLLAFIFIPQGLRAAVRLPPVVWYERDYETHTTFKMAFLIYWSLKEPKRSFTLFAPFYYNAVSPTESLRVVLPFHFRQKVGKETSTLWGPYFEKKTPTARTRLAVPFFWTYKDPEVSQGLIPPYFWRKKADREFEVGFPLYWHIYRKDAALKDIQIAVPWFRLRSESSSFRSFFPLYWGRTNKLGEDWNLFIPLLFANRRVDGSEKIVTPLFSRIHTPDGRTFGHGLLTFYIREAWGGKTDGFVPFFIYREDPDYYWFRFLLFYIREDTTGKHLNTSFFPLYKYKRDSDRRQILTPPAYFDWDKDHSRGYFANVFWSRDSYGNAKTVFFPLSWRYSSKDESTTVIPPLIAFHREKDRSFSMVAPFYFRSREGNDIFTVIPPFISRESPERTWKGLFFLYWRSAKPGRSAVTLLPFFRYSKFPNGRSIFVPPVYHLREGKETQGVAGIYLWDDRGNTRYNILPPLYWNFRRPTWQVRTLFPIYRFQNEDIRERGFFPLFARTVEVKKSTGTARHFLADSHRFLPIYFYRNLEHGHDLWMLPLLARFERGQNTRKEEVKRGRLFLLLYWERTPRSFVNRLDPIYAYARGPDSKGFMMPTAPFPLWRYDVANMSNEKEKVTNGAFFPYYWKESYTYRRDLFFPLFYRSREKYADGVKEKKGRTWLLLYYASQNAETDNSVKVFVPMYYHFQHKDKSTTLVPPYWRERSGNVKRDIFFPLYWRRSSPERSFSYFFPLYFRHKREKEEASVIFPVFWKFKSAQSTVHVVPPYFSVDSKSTRTKTSGVAPIWTTTRSKDSAAMNFQILGGFFGFERDAGGKKEITLLYLIKI